VVTEWNQSRALDLTRMKLAMRAPVLIDLRNMYRVADVTAHGFRYYRIGAPQLVPAFDIRLFRAPVVLAPAAAERANIAHKRRSTEYKIEKATSQVGFGSQTGLTTILNLRSAANGVRRALGAMAQ
jgi:hypothetical protein